jgi:predicted lipid-binding transport protein (Tim44 family)
MDREFIIIEILIFAIVALYLILRLHSILGRRTKEEQHRSNSLIMPSQEETPIQPEQTGHLQNHMHAIHPDSAQNSVKDTTTHSVAQIQAVDSRFDEFSFLEGAKMAFNIIVSAYIRGDTVALRPLLSDELYDNFSNAIREQLTRGEVREVRIVQIKHVDLLEAWLEGRTAFIIVKFISDQINIVRNKSGAIIEGNPDVPIEITDIWTFARNTKNTDPNWVLIESRPLN